MAEAQLQIDRSNQWSLPVVEPASFGWQQDAKKLPPYLNLAKTTQLLIDDFLLETSTFNRDFPAVFVYPKGHIAGCISHFCIFIFPIITHKAITIPIIFSLWFIIFLFLLVESDESQSYPMTSLSNLMIHSIFPTIKPKNNPHSSPNTSAGGCQVVRVVRSGKLQ